jgi:hypothetical protein
MPDKTSAHDECKEELKDLSNFYKKEHQFVLTLVQSAGNSAKATAIK